MQELFIKPVIAKTIKSKNWVRIENATGIYIGSNLPNRRFNFVDLVGDWCNVYPQDSGDTTPISWADITGNLVMETTSHYLVETKSITEVCYRVDFSPNDLHSVFIIYTKGAELASKLKHECLDAFDCIKSIVEYKVDKGDTICVGVIETDKIDFIRGMIRVEYLKLKK